MADNYLEKRMDDYRNGRLSSSRKTSKLTPSGNPSGRVSFQLAVSRVFVAMENVQLRYAISRAYAEAGCKVAFCGIDRAVGTEMAQRHGMMFCPVSEMNAEMVNRMLSLVCERWHGVELLLTDMPYLHTADVSTMLIVASNDTFPELTKLYAEDFSSIVYSFPDVTGLPENLVKSVVNNALFQGCNTDMAILTELNIKRQ